MIKAASWNVRGLNGVAQQRSVVQLVREFQLQFLRLVETRVRVQNVVTVQNSILQNWSRFTDYNGPGGRIWLAWLPSEVEVDILQVDNQYIHCKVTNKKEHTKCLITMLYGEYDLIPRKSLCRCIEQLATDICDDPWLITGDFNAVIDDSEVSGTAADTSQSMTEFRECVTKLELLHLPFTGAPFTWHNCSEGGRSLWKRLDRMLVNENWLAIWPLSKYLCSAPRTSDHTPLIIQGEQGHMAASIFRFENFMTEIPGFLSSIQDTWKHHVVGAAMYTLTRKLKALKPVLRGLRKRQGDLAHNVHMAEKFLSAAQTLNQKYQDDNVLILLEKCCGIVYCKAVALEVNKLQQRAKLSWIKGGTSAQRFSSVRSMQEELPKGCSKSRIQKRQEIKDALFDIDEDSAPGSDGFLSGFFKSAWAVIMDDFCSAVHDFFYHSRMLKQLNTTLLVLVPKVNKPVKVGDFRPIAFCNVIYKVINKIMVKRMQLVLDKLIVSTQNAFVPGRSISTNVLLAQELLSGYNQKKLPPRCMIKVDLQMDENSLCSLTHTTPKTHTSSNTSHAPAAMADDREDGELEDSGHGAVSATPATLPTAESDSTMAKLKAKFNLKEFFELASQGHLRWGLRIHGGVEGFETTMDGEAWGRVRIGRPWRTPPR
ncbi:hypothetical protein Sango_2797900 [Sesamum angolense]|uniref:Reverse transcriptase domain-containing protein n=1 Tax=Sesamum angolense TaxID=2727404 RepID=A0AAE1T7U0_9LAMI|nr:hypothetical protein Sango_2797900 [Sesamum angolense]